LAHLGLAQAYAVDSKSSQDADADAARTCARAAYQDFLALWKEADSNITILKQAKVEYAKFLVHPQLQFGCVARLWQES
jgi:hypothetical protein